MDFNWTKEREVLKDEIFKEIRDQKDQKQEQVLSDTLRIDPNSLPGKGNTATYGPFYFRAGFSKTPTIAFGQYLATKDSTYLVLPYVSSWHTKNGLVDGFMLGLYAVTDVPSGLQIHYVTWMAQGITSRYKRQRLQEAWQTAYEQGVPSYLHMQERDIAT